MWQPRHLRDIARYREEGQKLFYLRETWVTAGYSVSKVWVDETVTSSHDVFVHGHATGLRPSSGTGQLAIMMHISSKVTFIEGCLDGLVQKDRRLPQRGRWHRFERWFDAVLESLPRGSVLAMDNAS